MRVSAHHRVDVGHTLSDALIDVIARVAQSNQNVNAWNSTARSVLSSAGSSMAMRKYRLMVALADKH